MAGQRTQLSWAVLAALILAAASARRASAQPTSFLFATAPPSYSLTSAGFTVECWIRVRSLPSINPYIVEAGQADPSSGWALEICQTNCAPGILNFDINYDGVPHRIYSQFRVDDGTFHHAAGTYDGVVQRLYLDGVLQDERADAVAYVPITEGHFFVGNMGVPGFYPAQFDGQIDELRIWRTARTQSEIQANRSSEITPTSDVVGCWRFNGDAIDLVSGNALSTMGSVALCPCGGRLSGAADFWNPASCAGLPCSPGAIYSNDFEAAVGSEWSDTRTGVTPLGARRFLGQFANDSVMLTLSGLPAHRALTVSCDLYVMDSWDGITFDRGPDVWDLSIAGNGSLLHTTFSNFPGVQRQSYPDAYPGGDNPAQTGAAEVGTLGYGGFGSVDSVYHLTFTFPHSSESLLVALSGVGLQGLGDESWGIDNFLLTSHDPCPAGNVAASVGPPVDVLLVNDSAGGATRTVDVPGGVPVRVSVAVSPAGPAAPRYVVWAWSTASSRPFDLVVGGIDLGCVVNPTPFLPFGFPQPFRCLRGGLNSLVCTDVPEIHSPARAPWTLMHPGFPSPIDVTIQGVLQDDGAANPLGFSITNAIVLSIH
ncbi:MAG: LamG domain-containing protein [Planctomycetes bacterium]|nr:LamG domain-containing protein [Planctomycetota bacterium]